MLRWPLLLLLALLLIGCGDGGHSGAALNEPDGTFAIANTTLTFVDPTRPTAANGSAPGSDTCPILPYVGNSERGARG
ncbi:MAG TPA: hypothetical protein VL049_18870 [Candidatus Dormibacteraeota bacterium]|nr:hypothetical protein [Candidatus Dormibacteraeota bacterium]